MFKTILVVTTVLTILFGAASATVAAAQNNQPGEPLYAVRTWDQQIQLSRTMLQVNQQTQLHQSESGTALQTRDQIRLQTQDTINEQLRLQTQDMTRDQIRLQEQQCIQQSEMSVPQNPGGGYGPGPGTCADCTDAPQAQNGSGGQGQANPSGRGGGRP